MNKQLKYFQPGLAAICAPTFLVAIYFLGSYIGGAKIDFGIIAAAVLISCLVTTAHVFVLGLPAILILEKCGYSRWWTVVLIGSIAGCLPIAVFSWPVDLSGHGGFSHWDGVKVVYLKENGIPTQAGWIEYIGLVLSMGGFGAVCGGVFWLAQKRLTR